MYSEEEEDEEENTQNMLQEKACARAARQLQVYEFIRFDENKSVMCVRKPRHGLKLVCAVRALARPITHGRAPADGISPRLSAVCAARARSTTIRIAQSECHYSIYCMRLLPLRVAATGCLAMRK